MILDGKRVLITGGTGSLGKTLTRRVLSRALGVPRKIIIFSRDEAKQHAMRMEYLHHRVATDEVIYHNFEEFVEFRIGDVRDYHSVAAVLHDADVVFNAAALKQVPTCEYFPWEAVRTNVEGPENIVRVIREQRLPVETVVGVSTDKACKPVNVMGMTKAIQERIFLSANVTCPATRFICVRYGNVLASRGSVIPLFREQIRRGGPVTITTPEMTRFLLNLDHAVDVIFGALERARPGDTFIPKAPAVRVVDVASAMIGGRPIATRLIGVRPGEKVHEVLISEEECPRSVDLGDFYKVRPILPELDREPPASPAMTAEYTSAQNLLSADEVRALLEQHGLLVDGVRDEEAELLR